MKLSEIFLFARPEEKRAIEQALVSVVGPIYTTIQALGRGSSGGVEYDTGAKSVIRRIFSRPPLSLFLPKATYYLVVEDCLVEYLLDAVRGALASEGGPADCGRGMALVCPLTDMISVNIDPPTVKVETEKVVV